MTSYSMFVHLPAFFFFSIFYFFLNALLPERETNTAWHTLIHNAAVFHISIYLLIRAQPAAKDGLKLFIF